MNPHKEKGIMNLLGAHRGRDIFIVGTGTSLARFKFEKLNRRITIALNDALMIPGFVPKYHIFADIGIWKRYRNLEIDPSIKIICQPKARGYFQSHTACKFKDQIWHFNHVCEVRAMKDHNNDLYVQRTVATAGICLAWKFGANRIFLLGVDGFKLKDSYYWDGSVKPKERRPSEREDKEGRIVQDRHGWWQKNMKDLRAHFDKKKLYPGPWRGSGIYNLSWNSTIDSWQKVKVKNVLGSGCFKV